MMDQTGNSQDNTLIGDGDDNRLTGRRGDDLLQGLGGNDRLFGGRDDDVLEGGAGNDRLFGGSGNDVLDGGTGNDRLTGGAGDDVFVFEEGDGSDVIRNYEAGSDRIEFDFAESEATMIDTGSNVRINYDGGSLLVRDVEESDLDITFAADDTPPPPPSPDVTGLVFDSGPGPDVFDATNGRDVLVIDELSDAPVSSVVSGFGFRDTVIGFANDDEGGTPDDLIDLRALDANTNTSGDDAFTFIGSAEFSETAGELRLDSFVPFTDEGLNFRVGAARISGDVDGDGEADFQIQLQDSFSGVPRLDAAPDEDNFLL